MASTDIEYFVRRAEQAKRLAENAADQCARSAHLTMAQRYGELVMRNARPTQSGGSSAN